MKKITLKQIYLVVFCIVGVQVFAQQFTPTGYYKIKSVLTGNYITFEEVVASAGSGNSVSVLPVINSNSQIFNFIASGRADFNGKKAYNINCATGNGIFRAESSNVWVSGDMAPNTSNPRNFVINELGVNADTGDMMYSFLATTSQARTISVDEANSNCRYLLGEAGSTQWYLEPATVLSTDKLDLSNVFISNPVKNELVISGLNNNVERVNIYNVSGRLVLSSIVKEQSLNLDISSFTKGVYFIEMKGTLGSLTKKIIKQ
ncbi:T9SS type A sorting domain-containing protein [Aestuariibaculum suncheonense]|uniref:T9SS type A sorting domain-containing protein n=1 Tax=Aestuariibaculum suncheonense TaxID=1028745 RepID=A0A8J6QC36_9FLAO|nr:T9SS type A sorting domain-containing protein [Aestuariibaculum suncheonense]MBD0834798.1 T9SS type A sorting domain-containing protein [Aestuariibaculum suncheonense]